MVHSEIETEAILRNIVATIAAALRPSAVIGLPMRGARLLPSGLPLPSAMLLPTPLLLPRVSLLLGALGRRVATLLRLLARLLGTFPRLLRLTLLPLLPLWLRLLGRLLSPLLPLRPRLLRGLLSPLLLPLRLCLLWRPLGALLLLLLRLGSLPLLVFVTLFPLSVNLGNRSWKRN